MSTWSIRAFSFETTGQICMAALEAGITPLVRVPGVAEVSARARRRRARRHRAACALGRRGARLCAARQNFRRSATARPPAPCPICTTARFRPPTADAALNAATTVDGAVRERGGAGKGRRDRRASTASTWCMIGSNDLLADWGLAGQYEHPRLREAYAQNDRRLPPPRQACRRRRPVVAARARRRIRAHGRALCLDRHRSRLSACRLRPRKRRKCGR